MIKGTIKGSHKASSIMLSLSAPKAFDLILRIILEMNTYQFAQNEMNISKY